MQSTRLHGGEDGACVPPETCKLDISFVGKNLRFAELESDGDLMASFKQMVQQTVANGLTVGSTEVTVLPPMLGTATGLDAQVNVALHCLSMADFQQAQSKLSTECAVYHQLNLAVNDMDGIVDVLCEGCEYGTKKINVGHGLTTIKACDLPVTEDLVLSAQSEGADSAAQASGVDSGAAASQASESVGGGMVAMVGGVVLAVGIVGALIAGGHFSKHKHEDDEAIQEHIRTAAVPAGGKAKSRDVSWSGGKNGVKVAKAAFAPEDDDDDDDDEDADKTWTRDIVYNTNLDIPVDAAGHSHSWGDADIDWSKYEGNEEDDDAKVEKRLAPDGEYYDEQHFIHFYSKKDWEEAAPEVKDTEASPDVAEITADAEECVAYLDHVEILAPLFGDEKKMLAAQFVKKEFREGEFILEEEVRSSTLYILYEGEVSILHDGEEQETLTGSSSSPQCFGERALLQSSNPPAVSAQVSSSTAKTFALDREDFDKILGPLENIRERQENGGTESKVKASTDADEVEAKAHEASTDADEVEANAEPEDGQDNKGHKHKDKHKKHKKHLQAASAFGGLGGLGG